MQDERLSLTLPLRPDVLRHTACMLDNLADSMDAAVAVTPAPAAETVPPAPAAETVPPAPAAETVPPAPAAETVPPAPAGVELDEAGLPHDTRINPDSKSRLKTGPRANCWKYKKQLDPALIAEVEAELRAAMAVAVPAAETVPPAPAAETVPPAPAATGALDFPGIIQKVTALQNANRITPEQIQAVATAVGLASFTLLGARPDLIPAVDLEINKICPPIQS